MNRKQAIQVKDLAKPCNDIIEKLGWKWEPEERDEFLVRIGNGWQKRFITMVGSGRLLDQYFCFHSTTKVTPILHWEEIERVLEEVGYVVRMSREDYGEGGAWCEMYQFGSVKDFIEVRVNGKSRQEAVMKAVIKLGENLKERIDGRLHT